MVEDGSDKLLVTAKGCPHLSSHVDSMASRGGRGRWEVGKEGWVGGGMQSHIMNTITGSTALSLRLIVEGFVQ